MSKTEVPVNGKPPEEAAAASVKGHSRPSTQYPKHTLEEALSVARLIEVQNAGQPYPPTDIAIGLGISPGSSRLSTMLTASLRYGLSVGSYKADKIALTDLAGEIVAPTSEEQAAAGLARAALTPPTFKSVYEYFKGKKLPDGDFFLNTLVREFGVPKDDAKRCAEIFRANMQFVGLVRKASTGLWLSTEIPMTLTVAPQGDSDEIDADLHDVEMEGSLGAFAPEVPSTPPPIAPAIPAEPERPKAIFIGHGPDEPALTQLTKILDEWGLPYKVAEYEPTAGRPISQKVADLMDECGAAILIFTADRELRDIDGNPVWLSSANVSHELGATSVLYGGRVVIFKEKSVDLASNYSGIGYIEFEKGKLSAKAMELFREIREFGLIKISVGE
jgi:Predicted nucleotide-binding protein containing TIR-like domain